MSTEKKLERPLFIDMDFSETLRRYAQTKPEEVTPPPKKERKAARLKPKLTPGDEPSD